MTRKEALKTLPPDLARCQAEKRVGSFLSFGTSRMVRCVNAPTMIATERQPGKDDQIGSMSLCDGCANTMQKVLPPGHATLKRIPDKPVSRRRPRRQ